MRRTILMRAAMATALFTSLARGDAASLADDAGDAIAGVDARLLQHAGELQNVQRQLDKQTEALGDLSRRLNDQFEANKRLAPLIDTAIKSAQRDLDAARADFNAREQAVRAATNALTLARDAAEKARATAGQAAVDERRTFATSPTFVDANAKVDAAVAEVARLERELDEKVKLDVRAAKLAAESKPLEQKVAALRAAQPVDQAALADASAAWIAAKSAAETARREVFARSQPYADAQKAVRDARNAVDAQQAEFDRSILSRPGVAEALMASQAAAFASREAETDLAAARREQDRAAAAVTDRREGVDEFSRLKESSDGKLLDLRQDVTRLQASLAAVGRLLAARASEAVAIRRDVAGAAASIKAASAEIAKAGPSTPGGTKKK